MLNLRSNLVINSVEVAMEISYNNLWKLMIDQNINKSKLKEMAGISTNAVAKLGKNEAVSLDTLAKICKALNCDIGDIVEFKNMGE